MGAGEGERPEAPIFNPSNSLENRLALATHAIRRKCNAVSCDGMFERAEWLEGHGNFPKNLPRSLPRVGIAIGYFKIWELP